MTLYDTEDIKRRVSIVDVVEASGLHVDGPKRGKWLRTREHDSLCLNQHANTWDWFSRGEHGDVFDWVMIHNHVTFPEAVEMVARGDFGTRLPVTQMAPGPLFVPPDLPQDLHLKWHAALDAEARTWWAEQGIGPEAVSRFWLGFCPLHDVYRQPTMVIPVINAGKLLQIKHRLLHPLKTGDRYRPERFGAPPFLFNSDILTPDLAGVVIMAGEKKPICAWQYHIPAISGTGGCGFWSDEWSTRLQFCRKVYVAFDPGEGEAAERLAQRIGERVWIVDLPEKPDDFLTRIAVEQDAAAAEAAFREYLRKARPYVNRDVWAQRNGGSQWGKTRSLPR